MSNLWLEKELARQLAPVTAPDSLWDRINRTRPTPQRQGSWERAFWPVVAAMVLLALAGILRTFGAVHDPDTLVERELAARAAASRGFDFRSESFDDIRKWAKAQANIDIDRPPSSADPDAARLLGVRLIQVRGLPVAAIDYRVGENAVTLFVSGRRAGLTGNTEASRHLFSPANSAGDLRSVSWNMRNETYTIAFPGTKSFQAACLLCHATMPG
jgi:hypothetical protein